MGGIDARIPLSAILPQMINPMQARQTVARTKSEEANAQYDLARADALRQSRVDEANARQIVQSTGGDLQAASKALLAQGDITRGSALQSELDKMDAAKLQRTINTYREHEAHVGLLGQVLGSAKDQPSYDLARQQLTKMGMDTSDLGDTFDATQVASVRQMGMTAAEQIRDAREQAEATWRQKTADNTAERLRQTDKRDDDRYNATERRLNAAEVRDEARQKIADAREARLAQSARNREQYGRDMLQLRRDAERRMAGSAASDPTLKQDWAEYKGYLDEHEAQQRLENQYAVDPHYTFAQSFDDWRQKVKGRSGTAAAGTVSGPMGGTKINPREIETPAGTKPSSDYQLPTPARGSGQQRLATPAMPAPSFKVGDPVRLKDGSTGVIKGINPATGKYIVGASVQ